MSIINWRICIGLFISNLLFSKIALTQNQTAAIVIDSCKVISKFRIKFEGSVQNIYGIKLPEALIFAPRFDSSNPMISGHYDIEQFDGQCYHPLEYDGYYNIKPNWDYTKISDSKSQSSFGAIGLIGSKALGGCYRIRFRLYISKFNASLHDVYSNWFNFCDD